MPLFQSLRLPATVLAVALTAAACQAPTPTAPPTAAGAPAKGQGTIKGVVTASGVQASAFRIFQAGGAANASVNVAGPGFSGEVPCGPDGSFSVNVPAGADYMVTATTSDGRGGLLRSTTSVNVPLAEEPPIVDVKSLVTRRTGSIQGMLALADGSDPEGADVFIGGTTIVGKVSAKGRFALANVPEGTWNIVLAKPGYKKASVQGLTVKAGQPLVVSDPIALEKDAAWAGEGIKGLVRDNAGAAVAGATVTAFFKEKPGASFSAISDDQGAFLLAALPPGDYQIQVYRPFYQLPPRKDVTLQAGQGADLGTIQLTSTTVYFGQIAGEVVDEAGEPVDGAVVQLSPQVSDQVFTDAQGRFTLDRIMPGDYAMSVAAGGMAVLTRDLRVDNVPNFKATLDETLVLRATVDPAKVKGAPALPAAPILLPPEPVRDGDGRGFIWRPAGLPDGLGGVHYDIEVEDPGAPGLFRRHMTTEGHAADLPGDAPSMRIRSRAAGASYEEGDGPDAYDLLGFGAFLRKISRWFAKTIKLPVVTVLAEKVYQASWAFNK